MKRIKSYTSIWNVEKMIYAISDFNLPVPMNITQMAWFIGVLFAMIVFKNTPPVSMIDNALIKYVVIPGGVTWFISQKTFDGMKPYTFLKSVISYMVRQKETYMGNPVKINNLDVKVKENITIVRSEMYGKKQISDKIYRK